MEAKRILLLGASGTLGRHWLTRISENAEHFVIAQSYRQEIDKFTGETITVDLTEVGAVQEIINEAKPDLVINSCGATNVDLCEKRPDWAYSLNEAVPRELARQCATHHCRLVHISTDHLFDLENGPFPEIARPNPINVYGQSNSQGKEPY